jgi:K+-transporting ATPase ATPase A chain
MSSMAVLGIAIYLVVLFALAVPLGGYIHNVLEGKHHWLGPLESALLRIVGPAARREQTWRQYWRSFLVFNLICMLVTYAALRLQTTLPLHQGVGLGLSAQSPQLAFNTAASFTTNTNWQNYAGETLTYLAQIFLMILQFVTPALGLVVAAVFFRGLVGRRETLGNFYADLVRALVYIFLPLAALAAVILVALGLPDTFAGPAIAHTLGGAVQQIDRGPVAAFEAIKQIGTNGGGFFNANSAHPFENPNPVSNMLEILLMSLLSTSLVFTFGAYAKNRRQAVVLAGVTLVLYVAGIFTVYWAIANGNPLIHHVLGLPAQSMEGLEVRNGPADTALFASATTAYTTGAVNAWHDSLPPIAGGVPLLFMMLNTVFGGNGAGILNMLMFVVITVFVAGLMVGRTPEFLGKKIERKEITLATVAMLVHPIVILAPTAFALVHRVGTSSILNSGSHGISEVIYAYASAAANNGSAFAGLAGNTPYYNVSLGLVILVGRYLSMAAMLAMAGSLTAKRIVPASAGTLATDSWSFAWVYLFVTLIVGALTFFPALALGPIAEHLVMVGSVVK